MRMLVARCMSTTHDLTSSEPSGTTDLGFKSTAVFSSLVSVSVGPAGTHELSISNDIKPPSTTGSAVVLFSIHRHKAAYPCRRSSGSRVRSRGTEFWKNWSKPQSGLLSEMLKTSLARLVMAKPSARWSSHGDDAGPRLLRVRMPMDQLQSLIWLPIQDQSLCHALERYRTGLQSTGIHLDRTRMPPSRARGHRHD